MDRIKAMEVFVEAAERGSLTETASMLNMSRAMASRYLEWFEQWLGVRLLHRTTRQISLTLAGAEALQRCKQVLEITHEVQAVAGARRVDPKGTLRITASTSFAQAHLVTAIVDFLALYPQTQIELLAVERTVNLVDERMDLAVRIANRLDETLVARSLGVCRSVICASPQYLARYGIPTTPAQLAQHRCITHSSVGRTEYVLQKGGQSLRVPVNSVLQSNETVITRQATLDGAGIALLPTYFVSSQLALKKLVRLLPDYEPERLGIHAVYLSRVHQPLALRLMLDFLAARFGGEVAPWDREIAAIGAPSSSKAHQRRRPARKR
jgi:DNA-binding transcriptional LysR family regulator